MDSIPSKVHQELRDLEISVGRIVGYILFAVGAVTSGMIIMFIAGWIMYFTLLVCLLFAALLSRNMEGALNRIREVGDEAYLKGATQAEETLGNITVVKAFGQETEEVEGFQKRLKRKRGELLGLGCRYGVAFAWLESISYVFIAYRMLVGGFFVSEKVR